LKTALIAGLGLAQIGEFSFVLASEGQVLGLVSRQVYLLILGTTAVTLILTPFVLRLVPFLFSVGESMPWLKPYLDGEGQPLDVSEELPLQDHVVVCGYGRVGKNLVKLLQQHNLPVVVIDQSERRVQQLREAGVSYVYGNCVSLHVLETAGVNNAKGMAIALPDPMSTRLCLKRALELCPELDLVVRAQQDKEIEVLYQLGAREVVQPEFEASLEMATYLLTGLGLSPAEVQWDMQQIRNDHYLELRPECSPSEVSRDLEAATLDLNRRWYPLPSASPLIGMTLEAADMRYLTGASLMAIRRANGEEIDYPNNQTKLAAGDRLLLVGADEELAALAEFALGKAVIPGEQSACQWLTISADSPVLGKTLTDLDTRAQYDVEVQAIRRDGKFIRSPNGKIDLRTGDQVLLCGNLPSLNQIQPLFVHTSTLHRSIPVVKVDQALKE
jgi:CPA2 family monovalent cation:H+ antiporter-2